MRDRCERGRRKDKSISYSQTTRTRKRHQEGEESKRAGEAERGHTAETREETTIKGNTGSTLGAKAAQRESIGSITNMIMIGNIRTEEMREVTEEIEINKEITEIENMKDLEITSMASEEADHESIR